MNEKKLYKVTITDENGKVVHEVESDCIIAAISDPSKGSKEQSAIHGVYMTNCPGAGYRKEGGNRQKPGARHYAGNG